MSGTLLATDVEPIRCQVHLEDLLDTYLRIAEEAGVQPLPYENDLSVFRPGPLVLRLERGKWDAGIGSSWVAIPKGGREEEREGGGGLEAQGEGEGEDAGVEEEEVGEGCEVADWGQAPGDPEEGDAGVKVGGKKRKRPRGPGSKLSRKRGGKDLRSAGSNAAGRKVRITKKWIREGTSYQTSSYSLLQDGSHSSTGWQGLAPPTWKRRDVQAAYEDGSIIQALGAFFPVPYEQ